MDKKPIVFQNRAKSPVFWAGLISVAAILAKSFFDYDLPKEKLNMFVEATLSLLAALGVINVGTYKNHI